MKESVPVLAERPGAERGGPGLGKPEWGGTLLPPAPLGSETPGRGCSLTAPHRENGHTVGPDAQFRPLDAQIQVRAKRGVSRPPPSLRWFPILPSPGCGRRLEPGL